MKKKVLKGTHEQAMFNAYWQIIQDMYEFEDLQSGEEQLPYVKELMQKFVCECHPSCQHFALGLATAFVEKLKNDIEIMKGNIAPDSHYEMRDKKFVRTGVKRKA